MIILGALLLILGLVFSIYILWIIGLVLLVIGLILWFAPGPWAGTGARRRRYW
jgi:hypothetical protein